jgi:hypothetical protein
MMPEGDHCVVQRRAEPRHDDDGQQQAGEGHPHIHRARQPLVEPASVETGEQAEAQPQQRRDGRAQQSHPQGDARPVEYTAEQVAAQGVRAKGVRQAWRFQDRARAHCFGRIRGERRQQRGQQPQPDQHGADYQAA